MVVYLQSCIARLGNGFFSICLSHKFCPGLIKIWIDAKGDL